MKHLKVTFTHKNEWEEKEKENSLHVCLNDMFTINIVFTRINTNKKKGRNEEMTFLFEIQENELQNVLQLEFALFDHLEWQKKKFASVIVLGIFVFSRFMSYRNVLILSLKNFLFFMEFHI